MNTIKSLVLFCLSLLSGCGESTPALTSALSVPAFTPAERAEVEKYLKEGGREALVYYMRDYQGRDNEGQNRDDAIRIHKYITFLVSQGSDVNVKDDEGNTPLHFAVDKGNVETVKFLVYKGADVNAVARNGNTPFLEAVAGSGTIETVKFLVSKGANVNDGIPLCSAARSGNIEIVKFLVSKGSDVNAKNVRDTTPLHYAAQEGHLDIVKFLISKGADVNAESKEMGRMKVLPRMAAGTEPGNFNAKSEKGRSVINDSRTPLGWAKRAKKEAVVEYLSTIITPEERAKADKYVKEYGKKEALVHYLDKNKIAFSNNKESVIKYVKFFVSQGADVNAQDNYGRTSLHYAAFGGNIDIVEFLVSKGADVHAKDDGGKTPLHWAANHIYGQETIIEFLVSKGANVNAKDDNGDTPLYTAVFKGYIETAASLVSQGADVNAKDKNGMTPLHRAAFNGTFSRTIETVKFLVSEGANVNAKDNGGKTPLHSAASSSQSSIRIDVVKFLVSKGADVNAKTNIGNTPLDVANDKAVIDYLSPLTKK